MNKEPIRKIEHGRAILDYGTRSVPDDEYNGLSIGKGWRKHLTILCPQCHQASPYVVDLVDGRELEPHVHAPQLEDDLVIDLWTFHCPACHLVWTSEDQYYEE